jgi:transposase
MNFSCLSEAEVRWKYRRAADKHEMLQILCELTCSTKEDMQEFLGLAVAPKSPQGRKPIVYIDSDKARPLYEQGMSDREIANALGATRRGVLNWRTRNRLPCNKKPTEYVRPVTLDEKKAEAFYEQGMSDQQIAAAIGASKDAVRSWRRRTGRPGNNVHPRTFKAQEGECERLYRAGMVDSDIAMRLGVSIGSVSRWRHKNGLLPNGKQGRKARGKEKR